jgi:hypothetical protein
VFVSAGVAVLALHRFAGTAVTGATYGTGGDQRLT